jgi:excisionase family DNA binding protein
MRTIQEPDDRPLVSVAEAAALAGLSKSVAYRLASSGVLPGLFRLPGARLHVRRRVLEAWLAGADTAGVGSRTDAEP